MEADRERQPKGLLAGQRWERRVYQHSGTGVHGLLLTRNHAVPAKQSADVNQRILT